MSTKVSSYYWDQDHLGTTKLCLLALADFAGDDGIAYPGVARLAQRCSCKERNIQKILGKLQRDGELRIEQGDGIRTAHGHTNRYYLVAYRADHGLEKRPDHGVSPSTPGVPQYTPGVSPSTPLGVSPSTPDPSVDPSVGSDDDDDTPLPPTEEVSFWPEEKPEPTVAEGLHADTFGGLPDTDRATVAAFHNQHPVSHIEEAYRRGGVELAKKPISNPVAYVAAILAQLSRQGLNPAPRPTNERRGNGFNRRATQAAPRRKEYTGPDYDALLGFK